MTQTGTSAPAGTGGDSKVDAAKEGAARAAQDLRQEASDAAGELKDTASAQLDDLRHEARAQADQVVSRTREQVGHQADGATRQMADAMTAAGRELTSMAERSEQQDGPMTTLVRQIGGRATEMADRYQAGGYRSLARDLSGFARSNPGVFLLAATAAGFAVGRVVRNAHTPASVDAGRRGDGDGTSTGEQPSLDLRDPAGLPAAPIGIAGGAAPVVDPVGATGIDMDPGTPPLGGVS